MTGGTRLPAPGERLGEYVLEQLLGRGGMGAVYVGRNEAGATRAIKVPLLDSWSDELRERFEREARAMARIPRHRNVLAIHAVGNEGGHAFCVLELVEGEALDELVARGPLPVPHALELAEQIARALAHVHAHGIVHRDLKPRNVMVRREDGSAVLMDFGLVRDAAERERLTQTGVTLGTPGYMAPEQVESGKHVDGRADVFSLGVLLHELLAGERPFGGSTPIEAMKKVLLDDAPPLASRRADVPADVAAIVERALAKAPDERYATALAMAEDLARARRGEPTLARPLGPFARLRRAVGRRLGTAGLAAVAVALAAAAAALAVTAREPPREAPADARPQDARALERERVEARRREAAEQAAAAARATLDLAVQEARRGNERCLKLLEDAKKQSEDVARERAPEVARALAAAPPSSNAGRIAEALHRRDPTLIEVRELAPLLTARFNEALKRGDWPPTFRALEMARRADPSLFFHDEDDARRLNGDVARARGGPKYLPIVLGAVRGGYFFEFSDNPYSDLEDAGFARDLEHESAAGDWSAKLYYVDRMYYKAPPSEDREDRQRHHGRCILLATKLVDDARVPIYARLEARRLRGRHHLFLDHYEEALSDGKAALAGGHHAPDECAAEMANAAFWARRPQESVNWGRIAVGQADERVERSVRSKQDPGALAEGRPGKLPVMVLLPHLRPGTKISARSALIGALLTAGAFAEAHRCLAEIRELAKGRGQDSRGGIVRAIEAKVLLAEGATEDASRVIQEEIDERIRTSPDSQQRSQALRSLLSHLEEVARYLERPTLPPEWKRRAALLKEGKIRELARLARESR